MGMEVQDLKEQLIATNEEFYRLTKEHTDCKHQLEKYNGIIHFAEEQEVEEKTLKKKLALKDRMEEILQKHLRKARSHS